MADAAITKEVADAIPQNTTVLSIMGSVNLDKLHKLVPGHAVIRVMPNTPLAIGCGMTAIAPDENVSEEMLDVAKAVLAAAAKLKLLPKAP